MIASAIVFLVALFFIKNKSLLTNIANYTTKEANQEGLVYENKIIADLVNRDLDEDGVLDWEEGLWGTDPTKKDTNDDGTGDEVEIERLKKERGQNESQGESLNLSLEDEENLTQTDQFSREFFSTIATLNQNGQMDQETIDKLSSSLADHIQNSTPRKVFELSEIKIKNDNSLESVKNYNIALGLILKGYPVVNAIDVLGRAITPDEDIDSGILAELKPLIQQMEKIIDASVKIEVPQEFSNLHLGAINSLEKVMENLVDLQMIDTDVIVALSAINQYENSSAALESASYSLQKAIWDKLNT